MRTMGLTELVLVRPKHFPHEDATARAAGADDVLANARVVDSLLDAIADCGYVVGASARLRSVQLPVVNPRECAEKIRGMAPTDRAAIVFGPEQSGLTNDDLARCTELVHIPTDPTFGSLNVAMAVQVICYELRMTELAAAAAGAQRPGGEPEPQAAAVEPDFPKATAAELEHFHE